MTDTSVSSKGVKRNRSGRGFGIFNAATHRIQRKTLACLCLIALIVFISAASVLEAKCSQQSQSVSGGEYTIKLEVNMVVLSATVLDRHNTPVSGLCKEDFQVYEDGTLQRIKQFSHEDIPVTAGIVVDNSGSMQSKRNDVIAAALAFARSSNPQDKMFVVNFNDNVSFGLPRSMPFTGRPEELQMALSRIKTIGKTSLYDGIVASLDHLKQVGSDKKTLIIISDGGDNASKHSLAEVLAMAKQTTAIIYAIGIFDERDDDQNPGVLKRLSRETGGEAFFPESSKEVTSICEGIARDIRGQYTLAYVPAITTEDGRYRTVMVRASKHGRGRLSVRTKAGYSMPLPASAGAAQVIVHDAGN